MPMINYSIATKKLKKIGISSEKSEDGNIYLPKGDYILKINDFSRKFLLNSYKFLFVISL